MAANSGRQRAASHSPPVSEMVRLTTVLSVLLVLWCGVVLRGFLHVHSRHGHEHHDHDHDHDHEPRDAPSASSSSSRQHQHEPRTSGGVAETSFYLSLRGCYPGMQGCVEASAGDADGAWSEVTSVLTSDPARSLIHPGPLAAASASPLTRAGPPTPSLAKLTALSAAARARSTEEALTSASASASGGCADARRRLALPFEEQLRLTLADLSRRGGPSSSSSSQPASPFVTWTLTDGYGYGDVIPQTQAMVERLGLASRWFWVCLDARSADIVLTLPRAPDSGVESEACPHVILLDDQSHPVSSGGSTKIKVEYGKYHVASALVHAKVCVWGVYSCDFHLLPTPSPTVCNPCCVLSNPPPHTHTHPIPPQKHQPNTNRPPFEQLDFLFIEMDIFFLRSPLPIW